MEKWYKQSFWRNLVDMHIPDWNPEFMTRFSPERYAACMEKAEADAAELYSGNCLGICFWPTRAGHMHAGLHGKDIVGPTLEKLRNKGMHTIVYFNIWSRWAFDTHPDWRLLKANGTNTTQLPGGGKSRFGQCCLNSPGYRAYVKAQMEDLATQYDFDGVWIDMIGWFGTVCCCADCRRRYYEETGREIPETIDWFNPEWVQYQRRREAWLVDFTQIIDTTLRTLKPGVSIAFQSASWHSGWAGGVTQEFLSMSDYLAGDFYGNALMYTSICKFLNNATENRPIEFMTSRCTTLSDHTTIKTNEELGFSACAAFAHNGAFVFIDAINPDGTMNEKLYDNMGHLHRALKKYQLELSPGAALLRDVTFLFNFESFINLRANGIHLRDMANGLFSDRLNGSPGAKMMNISKLMIAHHLAYDLSCYKEIDEAISASQLVIIPNQYIIHAEELATLKEFAANGGSLIITGKSGIVDKDGNRLNDFCHAELTGVHLSGETSEDVTYMRPVPLSQSLFGEYDRQYPMSLETSSVLISADDDVTILSQLTLPYSHSQEIHHFGSAISNPPGIETDYPMMTVRKYGKGRVMYLAVPLEENRHESQQKVFSNIIRYMMERPPLIQTNGPSWLEFLVYQDEARKRYIIYAYKVMEIYYRAVARCVEISLRIPEQTGELRNIGTGQSVNYRQQDGRVQWIADEIDDFAMYTLEMNPR